MLGVLDTYSMTSPVGIFPANAFGLYDMIGNVVEWVEDCWHSNYSGAPNNGSAWTVDCLGSSYRVLRGGSWFTGPTELRVADRRYFDLNYRYGDRGIRIARDIP
jgi:formylglycine-generating enzyme required for sulfatase activity